MEKRIKELEEKVAYLEMKIKEGSDANIKQVAKDLSDKINQAIQCMNRVGYRVGDLDKDCR